MNSLTCLFFVVGVLASVSAASAELPSGYQPCATFASSGIMVGAFNSVAVSSSATVCETFDSVRCVSMDDVLDVSFKSTPRGLRLLFR
ncbi:MAG: hypothetical protein IJC66_07080 [Kiritimatiellae bacterium]|nr:hypothetical protein [Kiritimatiellia bacterium]MBR6587333.1 hypothetical protein [Kiritimatiellia bacterium]